ncbi:hypothetical protein IC575_023648 [Cucumis melo]
MEFCLLSQHVDRRSLFGTLYLACTFYRGRIGWLIMWFGFLAETGAFGAVQLCESNLVSVGSMNTKHGPVIAHFR